MKVSKFITPLEAQNQLGEAIGFPKLYFKREDLHPYGSHKGRSIPLMIDMYVEKGDCLFALSSSGNAALAAALHIKSLNEKRTELDVNFIDLDIFVGNNIAASKLTKLKALADEHIRVLGKEKPLQALTEATNAGARSLRQSTDDSALLGYESLAAEIVEVKNIGAVFIGTSSGTTAQALSEYFLKHKLPIQVHIVQTSSCHPMAETFASYDGPTEKSIADAIVDITAHRKDMLTSCIEDTGGYGWIATNDDIRAAQKLVSEKSTTHISVNSALGVVGAMKASYVGHEIQGAVVCLICGE